MQKNINNLNELEDLKGQYRTKTAKVNERITTEEENIRRQLDKERLPKKILNTEEWNKRVTQYLYSINIWDISFLNYNMKIEKSFNNKGSIYSTQLFFLDEEMKKIAQSYGIDNEWDLFTIMLDYQSMKKGHAIIQDKNFIIAWNKANTLGHLDKIFQNEQNRLDYQGTYAAFQYVKKHIGERLSTTTKGNEEELVWKDFDKKKIIVTENLAPIASYILTQRNQIPGARVFVNNGGLSRTTKKKKECSPTYVQKRLIDAIAFGTTIEKLQQQNYEDTKQLIYLPKK